MVAPSGIVSQVGRRCLSTLARPSQPGSVRKLRCTSLLMDRMQDSVFTDDDNLPLLSKGWRSKKRFRMGSYIKTARALAQVKKSDSSFSQREFPKVAEALFQEFHNSIATGQFQSLYDVATETLSDSIRGNPIPYASLMGTPKLTQITSFVGVPMVMQARLIQVDQAVSDVVFAQISVKFVSEAKVVTKEDVESSKRDKKRQQLLSTRISRNTSTEPGRFLVAFDPSGGEYYWNSVSRTSMWERPPNFLLSQVYTLPENGTLGVNGKSLQPNPVNGSIQQEHVVVFERPLFNLHTPWRICFF